MNENLAREYQARVAYTACWQAIKGAASNGIDKELEKYAGDELARALRIAKQIGNPGAVLTVARKPGRQSQTTEDLSRVDLDNESGATRHYRERAQQSEAHEEYAMAEQIHEILKMEQEHLIDLATALRVDAPDLGKAKPR
ncbi:MAG: ferritin-like domain-containing protein [bacterium]